MNSARLKLFEDVRAVVAGRIRDEGQIRELAQRISEESTDLRRRVDRAVSYARAGLRLEACAEAEAEPSVFELGAAFDAAHMRQWRDWCIKQRLPHSEDLPAELIGEVEEAIAQTQPLRNKLASMRRLVLSDAPAWQRLEVLRILVSRDPENHAWQSDRDALEPVAAKELVESVDSCVARRDMTEAEACVQRLEDGKWGWPSIGKAASQARARYHRALAQCLAEEARVLVPRLDAEWSAESEDGVRAVLGAWDMVAARMAGCGGQMPADLSSRVALAQQWLGERERSAADLRDNRDRVAELERLCQQPGATAVQLRAALRAAEETSEGVPDPVRTAAERRLDAFDRQRLRTRLAIVASIVLLLAFAGLYAMVSTRQAAVDARMEATASALDAAIKSSDLAKARQLFKEAADDPELAAHPRAGELGAALKDGEEAEGRRKTQWSALLDSAGKPESPTADEEIAGRALQTAVSAEEKTRAQTWIDDHRAARRAQRESSTKECEKLLMAIASDAQSGEGDPRERLRDARKRLADAKAKCGDIEELVVLLQTTGDAIDKRVKELENADLAAAQRGSVEALAAQSSSPDDLLKALGTFMQSYPGAEQYADFAEAVKSAEDWRAILAWADLQERSGLARIASASQPKCDQLLGAHRDYAEKYPRSHYSEAAKRLRPLITAESGWRSFLIDELDRGWWDLAAIDAGGGKRQYALQAPGSRVGGTVQVITSINADDELKSEIRTFGSTVALKRSPQQDVKKSLTEDMERLKAAPGECRSQLATALALFDRIAASDIDPIPKAIVLREFAVALKAGLKGTPVERSLDALVGKVDAALLTDVNWVDPQSAEVEAKRKAAAELLRQQLEVRGGTSRVWREFEKAIVDACKPLEETFQPAGVLVADGGTKAVLLRPGDRLAPGTELFVVDCVQGACRMQLIGTCGESGVSVDQSALRGVPAGTMVFRRRAPAGAKR